jgi:hypothetical protein
MIRWVFLLGLAVVLGTSVEDDENLSFLAVTSSFFEENEQQTSIEYDFDEVLSGDDLDIRGGAEPPVKIGEELTNTVIASLKMRFKIPDMNG